MTVALNCLARVNAAMLLKCLLLVASILFMTDVAEAQVADNVTVPRKQKPGTSAEKRAFQESVHPDKLVERNGVFYPVNSDTPFTGLAVATWSDGAKKSEATYKDGKRDGKVTEWEPDGKITKDGTYKDEKFSGVRRSYHENGQKEWETHSEDGIKKSSVRWYENGQKERLLVGKRETEWMADGQIKRDGTYIDGKLSTGVTIFYDNWRRKKAERNFKDGEQLNRVDYYENGRVKFNWDMKNEKTTGWYESGEKRYETFNGKSTKWYKNGQKSSEDNYKKLSRGRGNVDALLADGLAIKWYENGQKRSEETYKDGDLAGMCKIWLADGQLVKDGTYKDGKFTGAWSKYSDSGLKESDGTYRDGEFSGFYGYYPNGQHIYESTYKDGKEVNVTVWREDGQKVGEPETNSIGMKLKLIPSGKFTMGVKGSTAWSTLPHEVTLTKPFKIGVYEVTQAQYEKIMGEIPNETYKGANNPVVDMTKNEAIEFCKKLSALPAEKALGNVYRLPTEAEWEYACRAGTTTKYNWGTDDLSVFGKYGSTDLHPVGSRRPNGWGLYDMNGNVGELCKDVYRQFKSGAVTDPTGGRGNYSRGGRGYSVGVKRGKAMRAGTKIDFGGSGERDVVFEPNIGYHKRGFRVVCEPFGK